MLRVGIESCEDPNRRPLFIAGAFFTGLSALMVAGAYVAAPLLVSCYRPKFRSAVRDTREPPPSRVARDGCVLYW